MSERFMSDPRFPIGRFQFPEAVSKSEREDFIGRIASAPARLDDLANGLTAIQLDTPYRKDGWTVRQVIHHLPDSHMNSYVRFKLALTEDTPTIKTYDEAAWAMLNDSVETPVWTSLALLDSLHARWVVLMRGLTDEQWKRNMRHPERRVNDGSCGSIRCSRSTPGTAITTSRTCGRLSQNSCRFLIYNGGCDSPLPHTALCRHDTHRRGEGGADSRREYCVPHLG